MLDAVAPGGRERRLVSAILVLATIVLFFVAVNLAASAIGYFGDVLLAFFLAWLLAFIISPVVTSIVDLIPRLPRVLANRHPSSSSSRISSLTFIHRLVSDLAVRLTPALTGGPSNARPVRVQRVVRRHDPSPSQRARR